MDKETNNVKQKPGKSLWYFFFIMSSFLLINNFFFDPPKNSNKNNNKTLNEFNIEDFPIGTLTNDLGETLCSTINLGNAFLTLSSDNLPTSMQKNSEVVHLIKKDPKGLFLYSDKISPKINTSNKLEDKTTLHLISNLNHGSPNISTAMIEDNALTFFSKPPQSDAIALVESQNGLAFAGIWKQNTSSLIPPKDIDTIENYTSSLNSPSKNSSEEFFCLENEYMQVVFSNLGGAIAELNLKLKSKQNPNSPIHSVQFDQELSSVSPENAKFPINSCSWINTEGKKVTKKPVEGRYTPLLRRSLLNKKGQVQVNIPPQYYALSLFSKNDAKINKLAVSKFTKNSIQFTGKIEGKDIQRTFSLLNSSPYSLEMKTSINGNIKNLVISSGIPESEGTSSGNTPAFLYYFDKANKMKLSSLSTPKELSSNENVSPSWAANTNGFFTTILHPENNSQKGVSVKKINGEDCPSRLSLLSVDNPFGNTKAYPGYQVQIPFKGSLSSNLLYFYAGPLDKNTLMKVDQSFTKDLDKPNPEFTKAITVRGWLTFISDPFAKFMNMILNIFYALTSSWGISIILLTITLRLILYPFNAKAYKSMLKLKKIAPKQKALEAKYKNDPQRLRMELGMLFRNEGVNPLASILPIFLQIPFFIGMFDLLKTKFALRGATFIPGWIDNLTAPDVIFSWSTNIPFIGNEFHLLPVIGALTMHLSQKFSNATQEKKKNPTDMEKQMKAMGPILTVVFFFVFYNLASGLNIYLILSSGLGVLQQWYVNNRYGDTKKINVLKN